MREKAIRIGEARSSMTLYRGVRKAIQKVLFTYVRVRATGQHYLDLAGPTILAPVHRSHLDSMIVAGLTSRRVRALGKESLFTTPGVGYLCSVLGAIPVKRGAADKDALVAAKGLLDQGESMIVFPEGGRQSTHELAELFDGAAWLAARTGARVIPIGISGTGEALAEGSRWLRRSTVGVVVAEPIEAPTGPDGGRVKRADLGCFTDRLAVALAQAQDDARDLASS